ncbi:sulfite reductase, ferredoxin dependent [Oscillatoria sp. CS-180]|uniref:sulfite reductase, ferredoxin dependent n=1 Tax=Oscillatoria sp. CS-180 TaxID=3021720 RepID=UPI002330549D|nr:sulfite reductase, ferredoxin dependent [Oscillatoria sp. CS-180]MDB9525640.1 sulfite reductase, ferredoxin dependent [Oscillatoria sp. CS-180]
MVQTPIRQSQPVSETKTVPEKKVSKLERIKERSNFLREPLATELHEDTTHFTDNAVQILKFHGSYQQDNRDNRVKGQEKDYRMMLRTRNPGGFIPPQLYIALDDLSDRYGYGNLRATTRQGIQLHGILKQNLQATIATIIKNLGSTLGACGDLNRNVMAPPAPFKNKPEYVIAREYADKIADLLRPQTEAYYEIWLDGEKSITVEEHPDVVAARQQNSNGTLIHDSEEPIYGTHYMPRKFKMAVTVPRDNSVDAYTQDVTLVVMTDESGELQGFNVLAGGGMGRTHNKEETFARVADEIAYVDKDDVFDVVKAIVATQRDYGDRYNRRHARMKYLLHDWGVEKFRQQLEHYFGKPLQPFKSLPEWKFEDYLGWYEQGDGKWFVGVNVDNGRIYDNGTLKLRSALRQIVERFQVPMRITANQSVVLYDIKPQDKDTIQSILTNHGIVQPEDIDPIVRHAMACPALPMCGLAVTESERVIPDILGRVRSLLTKVGLQNEHFVIRMTGCPNGCARPYMAELGFVGSAPESYQIWLGGSANQTRLAQPFTERLHVNDLETFLEPLFVFFRDQRQGNETFGDFCDRLSFDALRKFSAGYDPATYRPRKKDKRHRIGVYSDTYDLLKIAVEREGRPMSQITADAVKAYVAQYLAESKST